MIANEQQLDELLSRPGEVDIELMQRLDGDVLILGVAGKMGPTLALRARRAVEASGVPRRVTGVARFTDTRVREQIEATGIETIAVDLLSREDLASLPEAANVVFMAGRKFGSTGGEPLTWAMNSLVPAMVAERYRNSRIVVFSSGNVYPLTAVGLGGPTEDQPTGPVGEYAQSALGRERMFQHFSERYGTPGVILRLNYAIDLRYGVLLDVATKVFERRAVDLTMGHANVIWQGDANSVALRALEHCQSPPLVLNLTGPETISIRQLALRFGAIFGVEPAFLGVEAPTALLSNAGRCYRLFGYPEVTLDEMIEWTAQWVGMGGRTLAKPTHFEVRDGKF